MLQFPFSWRLRIPLFRAAAPACLLALVPLLRAEEPVLRVIRSAQAGTSVLRNGGFDEVSKGEPVAWRPWKRGFRLVTTEGLGSSTAVSCSSESGKGEYGASQTLRLDRSTPFPLVVRGSSRAQDVDGSSDSGYSLYVDIIYADGTPLWGQTADFRCGTHDWEKREFLILPAKPVKALTVHCLFRGHTGKVWFDEVAVEEIRSRGGAVLFQGTPVQVVRPAVRNAVPELTLVKDGLRLTVGDRITSFAVDGKELGEGFPGGFFARDVGEDSDMFDFRFGHADEIGLALTKNFSVDAASISVSGTLINTTGRDRAIMLVFALPIDASGWHWGDDIRRSRTIRGTEEYSNSVAVRCGSTGTMSVYPLACLWNDRIGLALALDMAQPAVYRLAYNAGTKQLLIAYDFGLVWETERFPRSASFRFVIYRFDPRWGFRSAFRKFQEIFPASFVVRSRKQGIWMPFTDVSTVKNWADFGFRYHEGMNNVPFDDANGILSFRYTEPMTWWMPMAKEAPRTRAGALRTRGEWKEGANARNRRMAVVSELAGMEDSGGRPHLLFRNAPWCQGAVWSLNPNPYLPGQFNAATVHWNPAVTRRLYGPSTKGDLDGEYLDSLEGYVTAELNFRREHFRHTTVPLTFSRDSRRPALFKGLAVFEFTRWISEDVHRLKKLMFANGVPYRFSFLSPWLDVLGTETNWLHGGEYRPPPDTRLSLWRTMSGAKPYLLLMNTDYDAFTPDLVERYFQLSLFYGFYPSMFSHNAADRPYWKNPNWYGRDRHLFKKYIPIIRRVAESGWQPVTEAVCHDPDVFVERFGPDTKGETYLTLFNSGSESRTAELTVLPGALLLGPETTILPRLKVRELLSSRDLETAEGSFRLQLAPGECRAVRIRPGR